MKMISHTGITIISKACPQSNSSTTSHQNSYVWRPYEPSCFLSVCICTDTTGSWISAPSHIRPSCELCNVSSDRTICHRCTKIGRHEQYSHPDRWLRNNAESWDNRVILNAVKWCTVAQSGRARQLQLSTDCWIVTKGLRKRNRLPSWLKPLSWSSLRDLFLFFILKIYFHHFLAIMDFKA